MKFDLQFWASIGGVIMSFVGYWFRRWTMRVDKSLETIMERQNHLITKAAVTDERIKDIDKIAERAILADQRAKAAHDRLDKAS